MTVFLPVHTTYFGWCFKGFYLQWAVRWGGSNIPSPFPLCINSISCYLFFFFVVVFFLFKEYWDRKALRNVFDKPLVKLFYQMTYTHTCTALAEDKIVWTENLSKWASSDGIHGARFQIHQYRPRHILAAWGQSVKRAHETTLTNRKNSIGVIYGPQLGIETQPKQI